MQSEFAEKVVFAFLAIALLTIGSLQIIPLAHAQDTILSMEPPSINIALNRTFKMDINITDIFNLYGYEFLLHYDTSILTALNMTPYTGTTSTPGFFFPTYKIWKWEINEDPYGNGTGRFWVAITRPLGTPEGLSGNGTLITLEFNATGLGTTDLTFQSHLLGDPQNVPIAHIVSEGQITVAEDTTPPTIGTPERTPSGEVLPGESVKVSVSVTDTLSSVKNVTLSYTTDNGATWTDLPMDYNPSTSFYEVTIPGQPAQTFVRYSIVAYDTAENQAVNDNAGEYFVYQVVPEFPPIIILPLFMALTVLAIVFAKKGVFSRSERRL